MKNGKQPKGWILYPIGSRPRVGLAILLGIHHYLTMFGSTILIPFVMGGAMNLPHEELALLISTMFFASGITTLFQVSRIGNNLPIVQGGQFSFLAPSLSIIAMVAAQNLGWKVMIQQVSAAIMFASAFEIILGYTGAMNHAKRIIGPIVIGPVIAMIGLSLFGFGARWMAGNWAISLLTLLALIRTSPWFWIKPAIPFKWGFPELNGITIAGAFGMLAGYVSSMIESIGDYHSVCRMAEAPAPTARMISKGLGSEGLGCLVDGLLQTCNGTTSYTENISAIGLTRVAARSVIRWSAVIMLVLPLLGKFGAVMATLPQPVIGAMFVGLFGLIAAVGFSNLQFVNLNNARNLFIIGIGLFAGLSVPAHFNATPINFASAGKAAEVLGNILQAILSTGMADTAIVTALLDNLLPGATREERGLAVWESEASEEAWTKAEAEWKKMAVGEERKIVLE